MRHHFATAVSLCLVLVLATLSGCGNKTQFGLQAKAGDSRIVETEQIVTQEIEMMGQRMSTNVNVNTTNRLEIEEVRPDGTAVIRCTYESMDMDMSMNMGNMGGFDGGLGDLFDFSPIEGESVTFEYHPDGSVTNVQGAEALVQAAMPDTTQIPVNQIKAVKSQVEGVFGAEAIADSFSQSLSAHPEKKVGVGDSWEKVEDVGGPVEMQATAKSTVRQREGGIATLDLSGTVSAAPNASMPGLPEGADANMTFDGTLQGTANVEESTGWLTDMDATMRGEGSISFGAGGMNMSMPLKMTLKMSRTIRPG